MKNDPQFEHIINVRTVIQSTCTLIYNLSGRLDIYLGSGTLKTYLHQHYFFQGVDQFFSGPSLQLLTELNFFQVNGSSGVYVF